MFYKTGESYTFSQICFCPYFIKERIVAMRKFIFSGLDFCDPKQLFVFLNRQVTRWVFFCGLTTGIAPARAAICFLPDCMDKVSQTEGGNISSTSCKNLGFSYYASGRCPDYHAQEDCPYDNHYLKCNAAQWCKENGYDTKAEDCTIPQYPTEKCPNSQEVYKTCQDDYEKACHTENSSYVSTCSTGWKLDPDKLCRYSEGYGLCCNTCAGYDYTASTIPSGYLKGESCTACGNTVKYQKTVNPCEGYLSSCACGCDPAAGTCQSGSETKCKACKSCCSVDYIYTSANCPSPHQLGGEACDGKYKKCELDESSITCDNFTMPGNASYLKLVYSCDDLTSAVKSGKAGNIVIMKTLTCPTSLTLQSGQNLVGIGYFLKYTKESNDYENQLNQCYTLTLNNYLYTSTNSQISDLTLLNTPLYLKGITTIRNMNMKVTNGSNAIYALSTSFSNKMSGMVNIYTTGSVGIYNASFAMTDTKLNIKPKGGTNRGFYKSNITINGTSVINMDLTGTSGNGEAITDGRLTLNDNTSLNIKTNNNEVEAFNGDVSSISGTNTFTYINSPNVIIRAQVTHYNTNTFVHRPYFQYQKGNQLMTVSGNYEATASTSGYFSNGHVPSGSWKHIGEANFSSTSAFGRQMKIFETNFFQ